MTLVFNDTSTKAGILQDVETRVFGDEGYGSITGDTNRLYQFTVKANQALDRVVFLILTSDGRWQFDDNNYTDMAIGLTDLVSGQRNYTFSLEHLEIEKVLVQDNGGQWHVIKAIDQDDQDINAYLENNGTREGIPTRYDKRGDTIWLDVTPNYNVTNGIKVFFKRGASYFVSTDTTKVPGIASIFHKFISLHMSVSYAVDKTMPNAKNWAELLAIEESSIKSFYTKRNKDERPKLKPLIQNNK